jgi:hypothetical protein
MVDLAYLKSIRGVMRRYSKSSYRTLGEIDADIDGLKNLSQYLEGIVLNLEKQRERFVDEAKLNWMGLKAISEKYQISSATAYQRLVRLSPQKRRLGKNIEYVISDDIAKQLQLDGRSLRYEANAENRARKQAEIEYKIREKRGYMPVKKLLKRCHLTVLATLYHRLKQYGINYETKKIGKRLFFKKPSTEQIRLLRHRKLKYESIEGIKNSILNKVRKPRTLPGHVRLEDINRYLGTTDGIILGFMTELGINPHFVRAYGCKDPQFPKKYYKLFKKMHNKKLKEQET